MSKKIITPILLATLNFSSAFAKTDMCISPQKAICEDNSLKIAYRKNKEAFLKNLILSEANSRIEERIAEMKKEVPAFRQIRRFIRKIKIKNQEIMRVAKTKIDDLEDVIKNEENISAIKSNIIEAIDKTQFPQDKKNYMKSVVESTVIGNFADYINRTGLEDKILAQFLLNNCGSDGMLDNAFATTLNRQRYVLLCPGFLINLSSAL